MDEFRTARRELLKKELRIARWEQHGAVGEGVLEDFIGPSDEDFWGTEGVEEE